MDFVSAKAILDKFAHAYRAAEFMAEALDTAASLERRAMELRANVEHLEKEQAAQQAAQTIQAAQQVAAQQQAQQAHAARMAALQGEHQRVRDTLLAQRTQIDEEIVARRQAFEESVGTAHKVLAGLTDRITDRQRELQTLEQQIEALKAQARQVLG